MLMTLIIPWKWRIVRMSELRIEFPEYSNGYANILDDEGNHVMGCYAITEKTAYSIAEMLTKTNSKLKNANVKELAEDIVKKSEHRRKAHEEKIINQEG